VKEHRLSVKLVAEKPVPEKTDKKGDMHRSRVRIQNRNQRKGKEANSMPPATVVPKRPPRKDFRERSTSESGTGCCFSKKSRCATRWCLTLRLGPLGGPTVSTNRTTQRERC
jgi:hypothetical protein